MAHEDTWRWWKSKRLDYNRALVIAGVLAFVIYAALVWSFPDAVPDAEITAFTVLIQGTGYLLAMAVANVCFFAGPVGELLIKPAEPARFRALVYGIGKWFSVVLPFVVPVMVLVAVIGAKNA